MSFVLCCISSFVLVAAGITVAVVASDKVRELLEQAGECPTLKYAISIDCSLPEDMTTLAKEKSIELRTFKEVMVGFVMVGCVYCVYSFNDMFHQELGQQNLVDHQVSVF